MKKVKRWITAFLAMIIIITLFTGQHVLFVVNAQEINEQELTAEGEEEEAVPAEKEILEDEAETEKEVINGQEEAPEKDAGLSEIEKKEENQQNAVDESAPEITGLRMITEGEIYATSNYQQIELEVGYKESGTGIGYIAVSYQNDTGDDWATFTTNSLEEGARVGEGTVILESATPLPGTYTISSVEVSDYAGNSRTYFLDDKKDTVVDANDNTIFFQPEVITFEVLQSESIGIKIKDYEIVGISDKDQLSAGDSFEAVITIHNDTEKSVPINPEWCCIAWSGTLGEICTSSGEEFLLSPGEEAELRFPVTINKYTGTGEANLVNIWINTWVDNDLPGVMYWVETWKQCIVGYDTVNNVVDVKEYNGELDYTITTADDPDTTPPVVTKVAVTPDTVKAPGEIELQVWTTGEQSEIESIQYTFTDTKEERNKLTTFNTDINELSYSKEKDCYVVKVAVDKTMVKGSYQLTELDIRDELGNRTGYSLENGVLQPYGGGAPQVDTCEFEISESEAADEDFGWPQFVSLKMEENQTEAGGILRCQIEAEDEIGLSDVWMTYTSGINDFVGITLKSQNIIRQGDTYICEFAIDPYCKPGNYELSYFILADQSVRQNKTHCTYRIDHTIYSNGEYISVPPEISYDLLVTSPDGLTITDLGKDDLAKAAESAETGDTVVITGSYMDSLTTKTISSAFLEKVKEKELTVIVPDASRQSELVVNGKSLLDDPKSDMELRIKREDLVEDTAGVGDDNLYYPVNVVTSDAALPITVRVKIEKNFLDQCGDNPIRISKVDESGTPAVIAENVTVGEDGYVEISFPNGLQGTGVASQVLYTNSGGQRLLQEKYSFMISSQKEEAEVKLGDVNGDGEINIFDLTLCMNHIVEKKALEGEALAGADVNKDGEVNIFDLTKVMNYIVEKTTAL